MHGLYARHLSPEALEALQVAKTLKEHDLTEELAALRARLALLPENDVDTFLKGVSLVVRAAQVQHRMSPVAVKNLSEALARTLNEVGEQLGLPPAERGLFPDEP